MEIKPTYTTFEQAKWLFEKGFKGIQIDYGLNQMLNNSKTPEQWEVVEWLRINHGIWVVPDIKHTKGVGLHFGIDIWKLIPEVEVKYIPNNISEDYNSPQEAYSAAFDYIKQNNLIETECSVCGLTGVHKMSCKTPSLRTQQPRFNNGKIKITKIL